MVFRRFVEVGRIVLINQGPDAGKLAVIVDCIDAARVLVDGPCSGVGRKPLNYKHLSLTDFKIDIIYGQRTAGIRKAYEAADINGAWEKTAWAKKLAQRKKRASLTDFERFVVKVNKQKRNRAINKEVNILKKKK
eukprot:m.3355 g.3355  ORF g.3355 m.3355 type:complete len:135 (+) comp5123_c0_seq1:31-435(+)